MHTYSKVAIGAAALGQSLADAVYEVLLAASSGADALLLEFDLRHGVRSRSAQLAQLAGGVIRVRSIEGDEVGWGSVAGWSEDACAVAARRAFGICNNTLDRCEVPVLCWGWAAAELEARAQGIIGAIFTQIITTTSRFSCRCCCRNCAVPVRRNMYPRDLIWK